MKNVDDRNNQQEEYVEPTDRAGRVFLNDQSAVEPAKRRRPVKRIIIPLVIVLALLAAGAVWYWQSHQNAGGNIEGDRYQALFLSNGQVYFGKLATLNGDYYKLTDIYYLQANSAGSSDSKNPQATAGDASSDVKLIKLGSEVHAPEDEMIVSKEQVLFFENLKPSGNVAQSIKQYESKK